MTTNTIIAADASGRSLSLMVARWSQERMRAAKSLINDILCRSDLSGFEVSNLHATREALEKAEAELNVLNGC